MDPTPNLKRQTAVQAENEIASRRSLAELVLSWMPYTGHEYCRRVPVQKEQSVWVAKHEKMWVWVRLFSQ